MKKLHDEHQTSWLNPGNYRPWQKTTLMTLLLMGLSILSLVIYSHFNSDLTSDSLAGYSYAILGTIFMLLATFAYTRARKRRHRKVGQLNASLNWHICFGIVSLFLLLLHSFGNFNPRTGTYAMYGMIALVVSGIVGKILDRTVPRIITHEVGKALTEQGEDRIETISRTVQEIVAYNTQELQASTFDATKRPATLPTVAASPVSMVGGTSLPGSWDIAYITLEETPQEVSRNNQQYRFIPDRKSPLTKPGALMPGYNEKIVELQHVQQALQREQYFRALIRYWRIFHVILVLVTIGLTIWHIEYAAALLIPTYLHH